MKEENNGCWIPVQYASLLIMTLTLGGFLLVDIFMPWVIAMLLCLYIPAVIIAIISFFLSLRCNTKHKRILMGLHLLNITLFAFWWFYPGNKCDADIMEAHYLKYGDRMEELYKTVYDRLQSGQELEIEFEYGKVSMFNVSDINDDMECNWDPSEERIDTLLRLSGLDRAFLKDLKRQLKEIGCMSISVQANPEWPYKIGFRRIGMGKYGYRIYRKPLSVDEQKKIQENYTSIVFSPYVVFEYGGGAFGSQFFFRQGGVFGKEKPKGV